MIDLTRSPMVREMHDEYDDFNYYLLSREEANQLLLLTEELIERANKIMMRVMRIQEVLATNYEHRSVIGDPVNDAEQI